MFSERHVPQCVHTYTCNVCKAMLSDLSVVLSHARLAHTHTVSTQTGDHYEVTATHVNAGVGVTIMDEAPDVNKRVKRKAQEVR